LSTPNFQIWLRFTSITSLKPIVMPISGNIYVNLAKAVTIPEAPWQKCTSFTYVLPVLVAKFPFIRYFNKYPIEALIKVIILIV
jgi:hypothetical protein